jgi:DnaJ family protein C protein 27
VAGDDVYFDIRNEFYKDTHGAFLVFDISDRATFENLTKWHKELKDFCSSPVVLFLIANKIDKEAKEVGKEEAMDFAK